LRWPGKTGWAAKACHPCHPGVSLDQAAQPFLFLLVVRRIKDAGVEPARFHEHRLPMAKRLERGLAVIRAHPAVADSAERQPRYSEMDAGVVHGNATRTGAFENLCPRRIIIRKQVERERLGPLVHKRDCLLDIFHPEYR